ncbi:unnamed protein product [Allacma fusca]|uniref:Methyltransferase FkbM domain-containing protein n=1 Tax=Allacma fusca TaxID=39272 RepID=A0A8J2NTJ5_9HEXA|nr:unnamed protein product [Allacma fusca]
MERKLRIPGNFSESLQSMNKRCISWMHMRCFCPEVYLTREAETLGDGGELLGGEGQGTSDPMKYTHLYGFVWIIGASFVLFLYFYASRFHQHAVSRATVALPSSNTDYGVSVPLEELMKGPLAQNDSRILDYIWKRNFIRAPSKLPYNLSNAKLDPSMGQSIIVKHALNEMRNGFFVECGALDGETRSNTLMLERDYGWQGLLIEGDPKNFERLITKNRKAWSSDACLATKRFPHQVIFKQHFNMGKISSKMTIQDGAEIPWGFAKVQCFPLFSLLSALNISVVDYLSLDVEGNELDVLRTVPFDAILIKVLSVEYVHDKGGREAVKKFMTSKGFRIFGEVRDPRNLANDFIFVNNRIS